MIKKAKVLILFFGLSLFVLGSSISAQEVEILDDGNVIKPNYYPVYASISPSSQTITGATATASWDLSWGGGDGRYNVFFSYGDGNSYEPSTQYNTGQLHFYEYSLGSSTYAEYSQTLIVSSSPDSDSDSSTVTHDRW
ncbi:hypothetical protein [Radiobacillus sp. PE A8.2]|uniref:hypothetical protein n=1 Tax=Radiobacillus sp. PE A8.2 TaxID=3380349 RepID=UPI00388FC895